MKMHMLDIPRIVSSEELRKDLDRIIRKNNGDLAYRTDSPSQWGRQYTEVYEIDKAGCVTTMTNDTNHMEGNTPTGRITYSAMVLYLGFDESSREYMHLVNEILSLEKNYRFFFNE
jgi:hypothetical protein